MGSEAQQAFQQHVHSLGDSTVLTSPGLIHEHTVKRSAQLQ